MGLTSRWRTRPAVSNEAIAVGSFGESVITFQLARAGGNIVDYPMVDYRRISRSFVGRSNRILPQGAIFG